LLINEYSFAYIELQKIVIIIKIHQNPENNYYKELRPHSLHYMTSQNPTTTTSMDIEKLADEFDNKTPQEVLKWALDTFGNIIALA
jgi:hypothetical protein